MKHLKHICCLVIAVIMLTAIPLSAATVIGAVLSTDIKAYINGAEIPAYNINGNMVIVGSDLRNYGFNVVYNNDTRTSSVSYTGNGTWNPITSSSKTTQSIGTKVMDVYDSDITVLVNGNTVTCYNVDGKMAFKFSELKVFGDYYYDNTARTSNLWLTDTATTSTVSTPQENKVETTPTTPKQDSSTSELSVYGKGDTWIVDGQWEFTINSVTTHELCNEFTNERMNLTNEQIVIIDYSYKNIGYDDSGWGLYFSSVSFDVYDEDGEATSTYACTHTESPKECVVGTKCSNAQEDYVLKNNSDYITIIVGKYTSNDTGRQTATFVIPVE